MCPSCEDFVITVALLGSLALYAERPRADAKFVDIVSAALALGLPPLPPGIVCPPDTGPDYPGPGW